LLIDEFFAGQPENDTGKQGPKGVCQGNRMSIIKQALFDPCFEYFGDRTKGLAG
jgi:hypothetical protein